MLPTVGAQVGLKVKGFGLREGLGKRVDCCILGSGSRTQSLDSWILAISTAV